MRCHPTARGPRDVLHDGYLPFYGRLVGCVVQLQGPLDIVDAAPDVLAGFHRGEHSHNIGPLGFVVEVHHFAASANQVLQPLLNLLAVTVADVEVAQTKPVWAAKEQATKLLNMLHVHAVNKVREIVGPRHRLECHQQGRPPDILDAGYSAVSCQ
jgi:hypothetical protein